MHRIVSLIASATEIICALGFEEYLVGRSHECDFPETVKRLPVCTEPKFDVNGSSYAIDQRVKAILQEGLSVYRVDAEKLRELQPTLVVTQSQCEVCAVSLKDVEQALCTWLQSRPRIVSLSPNSLSDVWGDIRQVAKTLDVPERGVQLVSRLQHRMVKIADRTRSLSEKPTVACIEWIDPLMAAGNWTPELVEMAGGVNLFGRAGQHAPWMTWEELCARNPDVIVVMPCGFDIARSRQDMPVLTCRHGWEQLFAARDRRVYLMDGNQYFNRPGPRLVESLDILAEVLHPDVFPYQHQGIGWQYF